MKKKIVLLISVFLVSIFLSGKNDLSAIEGKGDKKSEKKVITACDGETQVVLNDVSKDEVMTREKAIEAYIIWARANQDPRPHAKTLNPGKR